MKKKIFIIFLAMFLFSTPVFAWGHKKNSTDNQNQIQSSGYVGTLPDLTTGFQEEKQQEAQPILDSIQNFDQLNNIKPTPTNNPAFINIIQKKDRTSQYVNDLQEIIPILEQIQNLITSNSDTQHFNAASHYLNENVVYLRDKYKNKSESTYSSFKKLMQLNLQMQTVANLRSEKEIYAPYLVSGEKGYIYGNDVINQQIEYLLSNLEDTLLVLKEAK